MMTEKAHLTNVERIEADIMTEEELLNHARLETQKLFIKKFNKSVVVKPLSLEERDDIVQRSKKADGRTSNAQFTVLTLIKGLVEPKLSEQKLAVLMRSNGNAFDEIVQEIWKLSGLDQGQQQKND